MILVNIGSDNVSVLLSNKPSPEPMLPNFYDAIWRHYTTNHNTSVWCSQCRRGKSDTVIGTLSITRIVATSILLFFSKCHCLGQGHVTQKKVHAHTHTQSDSQPMRDGFTLQRRLSLAGRKHTISPALLCGLIHGLSVASTRSRTCRLLLARCLSVARPSGASITTYNWYLFSAPICHLSGPGYWYLLYVS